MSTIFVLSENVGFQPPELKFEFNDNLYFEALTFYQCFLAFDIKIHLSLKIVENDLRIEAELFKFCRLNSDESTEFVDYFCKKKNGH